MAERRGRKRRVADEPATERVWALLTRSEKRALQRVALTERVALGVLVREAINSYVGDFSDEKPIISTGKTVSTAH